MPVMLLPQWNPGQSYFYAVKKIEKEVAIDVEHSILDKYYEVELKVIDLVSLEVYFPSSILLISAYFEEWKEYFPELISAGLKTIYVKVGVNFDHFYMNNMNAVRKQIAGLKTKLLQLVKSKKEQNNINKKINPLLLDDELLSKCFLEDMYWMFEFYGIQRLENTCIDLNQPSNQVEAFVEAIAGQLGKKNKNIDLARFDRSENQEYEIQLLAASLNRHSDKLNLQTANDEFIQGQFDARQFTDLNCYHKVFHFDTYDWLLQKIAFFHTNGQQKKATQKIVEINRIK